MLQSSLQKRALHCDVLIQCVTLLSYYVIFVRFTMPLEFLSAFLLVIFALALSYKENLGNEKQLLLASLRAILQLIALGYALRFIFAIQNNALLVLVYCGMIFFATLTASTRHFSWKDNAFMGLLVLTLSSTTILGTLLLLQIIHFQAHEFIPLAGMVIGNALNVYTQTLERFRNDTHQTRDTIEGIIALGGSLKVALKPSMQKATKAALTPMMNNLKTVGIVWIPGVATGMLLAGADPLKAVMYQVVIMYMMVSVSVLAGYLTVTISYKKIMY